MLIHISNIIFPIIIIVFIGYLYALKYPSDMTVANRLTINIFVPALVFSILASKKIDLFEYQYLAIGAISIIFISGILAWIFAKVTRTNIKTFVPPMMYANSGNIGLPVALLAFGEKALPAAIILFMIENTLHFTLGIKTIDKMASIAHVLKMPMILASFLGILVSLIEFTPPKIILNPLIMIGEIAIPLMLFSLGVRLAAINWSDWKIGIIGAIFRPVFGLISLIIVLPFIHLDELNNSLLIIFAILPPAVLNFLVAEKYNQEPEKVASIVLIGNLFSLLTIPITLYFLLL